MTREDLESRIDRRLGPVSDDIGSRSARRRQVVALYGGYLIASLANAFAYGNASLAVRSVGLAVVLAGYAAVAYGFWMLMRRTTINAPNISDRFLDERQRMRRDRAMRAAWMTISLYLGFAALYSTVALTAESWAFLRSGGIISFGVWLGFLMSVTLPTSIMAWNEPDPEPEVE